LKKTLSQAVDFYLETRRQFGFALVQTGVELRSLVRYAEQSGHTGPLTSWLAIQWAQEPQRCQPSYWALRLAIARRFAQFWLPYDSRTEIPPPEYFGPLGRRRAVHIYSPDQVGALLKASAQLGRAHSVRAATFRTVVGLLECTGLRIGEALGLSDEDIDWSAEVLTIRHAKGGQTRLVPVQSSTMEALGRYRCLRRKAFGRKAGPRFFVNSQGTPLGYFGVNRAFHQLRRALGWTHRPIPRLHDLRHTFAVRTLLAWYRSGEPLDTKLWTLSTYLGHRHLADTYWYLSAVPELMQLCQQRFAAAQTWASRGADHE
jgi:integrase/recombinase XerC